MAKEKAVKTKKGANTESAVLASVGLMWPIVMLLYLVIYLKASGLTWQSYFSNYDNAILVWSVGFDFLQTILSTIDTLTGVLGMIFDFIVDFISKIIDYIIFVVKSAEAVFKTNFIDRLAIFLRNMLEGIRVV